MDYTFIPIRYDNDNSSFWKKTLVSKHNYKPSDAIFTGRKEKYTRNRAYDEGNILIDDKPKNIEKWIAKGSIGILYQANQDSLKDLYNKVENIMENNMTYLIADIILQSR